MTVDFENDLLLITAASGKQAAGLLPHVSKRWKRLRLSASSAESKARLEKRYPNAEVVQCDLCDAHACQTLLEGVTACFLITPGFHPHEVRCGYNIIDAAVANAEAGGPFKHMLHSSVLDSFVRKMVNHDNKRYVEEYLAESDIPFTIIQPTHIMETVDLAALDRQEKPVLPRFWNPETPFSFVSTRDLGEAAARIFEQREKHYYATYQLVSTPKPLSYADAVKIISEELGTEVRFERKSVEEGATLFASGAKSKAETFAMKQGAARMLMYYNDRGLLGNSNVLEMLLGRKPLDYRDWVRLSLTEIRGK